MESRKAGGSVGFVPTMGALHEGHISLVRLARKMSDLVVVSVFVNPVQFGPAEDFVRYPRNEKEDCDILQKIGCDLVFIPDAADIYTESDSIRISVSGLSDRLCGASRPGHFEGVLLIVAKLFNIVLPDMAFFGQKDAQQAVIIQRMVADLDFPVRVVLGPTARELDGLAMSSRNGHLSEADRRKAPGMYRGLREAFEAACGGERNAAVLKGIIRNSMEDSGFHVGYTEIVRGENLVPVEKIEGIVLMAAAGRLSDTRLIDNIAIRVDKRKVEEVLLEFPDWSRYEF